MPRWLRHIPARRPRSGQSTTADLPVARRCSGVYRLEARALRQVAAEPAVHRLGSHSSQAVRALSRVWLASRLDVRFNQIVTPAVRGSASLERRIWLNDLMGKRGVWRTGGTNNCN